MQYKLVFLTGLVVCCVGLLPRWINKPREAVAQVVDKEDKPDEPGLNATIVDEAGVEYDVHDLRFVDEETPHWKKGTVGIDTPNYVIGVPLEALVSIGPKQQTLPNVFHWSDEVCRGKGRAIEVVYYWGGDQKRVFAWMRYDWGKFQGKGYPLLGQALA